MTSPTAPAMPDDPDMAEQEEPVRRRVALKVIKLGMDTKSVVARFEAERQALAMMDHPNIARVLDAGATDSGRPFFVMKLVRGIPITRYCDENKLDTRQRLDLFIKVCHAIQHAHQKGIIHRDIKPSNILVTLHDGVPVPKVIDFGIAKATEGRLTNQTLFTAFEQFIGTPAYMSPEQAEMSGLDIDTRSDIYALGVLLYELLTGKTPFDAKELAQSGLDAMRKTIREKEPVRPSTRLSPMLGDALTATANAHGYDAVRLLKLIRGDLDWIVMKCLEKDRTRRYETANGLAADLKRHLDNEPVVACPPSAGYRFQKAFRRNKLIFAAVGAAVTLALVLGLSLSIAAFSRERRAFRALVAAEQEAAIARVRYSILSGDDDRTEEALREAAAKHVSPSKLGFLLGADSSRHFILELGYRQILMLQGKPGAVKQRCTSGETHHWLNLICLLAAEDSQGLKQAAHTLLSPKSEAPGTGLTDLYSSIIVYHLLAQPDSAEDAARTFAQRSAKHLASLRPHYKRLVQYLQGELGEESLLSASRGSQSALCESHFFVGVRHLSLGMRTAAYRHFAAATETDAVNYATYFLSGILKRRLDDDPAWPPTIPASNE